MRLASFKRNGQTRLGAVVAGDRVLDLSAIDPTIPAELEALLEAGPTALDRARRASESTSAILTPLAEAALQPPVSRPSKILAIGLNYRAHAQETNQEVPEHPVVFAKFRNTIVGPGGPIIAPNVSTRIDWEGELCVIIGRRGRRIPADRALEFVAGYMNGNDVSVRDWQRHAATWTMGKNFDTHGAIGPWLVTADEVPNPASLILRTWVNGVLKQESGTDDLIFSVPEIIEYLSTAMTLEPGDVIFTGTPSGVGSARRPQEWLKPGDVVRVEITGLGVLENPVVAEE